MPGGQAGSVLLSCIADLAVQQPDMSHPWFLYSIAIHQLNCSAQHRCWQQYHCCLIYTATRGGARL